DAYLDRGAGLNLELQFQNLNLQALYGTTTIFRLRDGAGRIHYNAGWATSESDYSFARLHFEHPLFNVNVETGNDPLSSPGSGRRTDAVHTVRVQGHLNADGKRLTYFDLPSRGRLNINYQHAHSEQDTLILPQFEIELKNVLISTVGELRDLFETDAELRIKHALISRKSGPTAPLEFSANGDYDGIPFEIESNGTMTVRPPSGVHPRPALQHGGTAHIRLGSLTYNQLLTQIMQWHGLILFTGSRDDARRAEDVQPIWQTQFVQSDLYAHFLERSDWQFQLEFLFKEAGQPLPDALALQGSLTQNQLSLRLPDVRLTDCYLNFEYTCGFHSAMPHHDYRLYVDISNNRSPFPALTGSTIAPGKIKIKAAGAAEGYFPGDLVHFGFSQMDLEAEDTEISDRRLINLIQHGSGQIQDSFQFRSLRWLRNTDAARVTLNGYALTESFRLSMESEYVAGQGGDIFIRFNPTDSAGRSELVRLRMNEANQWTPAF
ncbi:MAG: hypothetical protein KDK30_06620, partial [Leptospiraceae bacterium]|nr:hypothetical protein [Leptospiraceae bacterium]